MESDDMFTLLKKWKKMNIKKVIIIILTFSTQNQMDLLFYSLLN